MIMLSNKKRGKKMSVTAIIKSKAFASVLLITLMCVFIGMSLTTSVSAAGTNTNEDINIPIEDLVSPGSIKYGDVNGDGEVNSADVVLLRKYMADYNFEAGTSTVDVAKGADANGDGEVNSTDVVLLRKYMADYDYETGSSSVVLGPQG